MRKIVAVVAFPTALATAAAGAAIVWRRNPRLGTAFVNSVVNPALLRRGLADGESSEIAILEHVGRRSGIRRLTPVHPEPALDGFRILVPLGPHSEWARNVVAAGHCRLQWRDVIYDLDEPVLIPAGELDILPWVTRQGLAGLGFAYLVLRTFRSQPGTLDPVEVAAPETEEPQVRGGDRATPHLAAVADDVVERPAPALPVS